MEASQSVVGVVGGSLGWTAALALALIALNAFFVSAEIALVKVRPTRIEELAADGSRRARLAQSILGNLDRYIATIQLGVTGANVLLGYVAEPFVARLLTAGLAALGVAISADSPVLSGIALLISLSAVTLAMMIFGEQSPKIWAIHHAERVVLAVAMPLRAMYAVLRPLVAVVNGLSNAILRLFGLSPEQIAESSHSADELKAILAASARAGHISAREQEFGRNILGLVELEVRHILVPRVDVALLSLQASQEENLEIVRKSGHSRFPLCQVGLDSVIGIVHAKDVMGMLLEGREVDLPRLARKPTFVSETQSLSGLILLLQESRAHLAIVLDEHGTAIGLAFLEDALEEIVGPIQDEFDEEAPYVRELADGAIEMRGEVALPEAAERLGLDMEEERADTIGGYVVSLLGRLPRRGDEVQLGPWRASIIEVTHRRIERLRFDRRAEAEAE
jgi:CBS domain containing-hemolysin-like protein